MHFLTSVSFGIYVIIIFLTFKKVTIRLTLSSGSVHSLHEDSSTKFSVYIYTGIYKLCFLRWLQSRERSHQAGGKKGSLKSTVQTPISARWEQENKREN